ncbi:MAG: methyltransferase domain-containing protein [Bernardetiaceae bacterium]|nr:methyltransferase domain-containing protein [Bernardetiaceae bacterium]
MINQGYYNQLASAFVRGSLKDKFPNNPCFEKKLEDLLAEEHKELIKIGISESLPLSVLERALEAPYITRVFAILRGIQPDLLLDIGKSNNDFIWRLLDEFRFLPVTAIDIDNTYDAHIKAIHEGGINNLRSRALDVHNMKEIASNQYDVVTSLNALPYLSEPLNALSEICRVTKRFMILAVPTESLAQIIEGNKESKTLNETKLREELKKNDILQIKIDYVEDFTVVVARK